MGRKYDVIETWPQDEVRYASSQKNSKQNRERTVPVINIESAPISNNESIAVQVHWSVHSSDSCHGYDSKMSRGKVSNDWSGQNQCASYFYRPLFE